MTKRATDLVVEKLALGELDPVQAETAKREVDDARLEQLRASNAEILRAHPPAEVAAEVRRRIARTAGAAEPGWRWRRVAVSAAALAAASLLAWCAVQQASGPRPTSDKDDLIAQADPPRPTQAPERIYLKGSGDPKLVLYRDAPAGPELLPASARVQSGDAIQVKYDPAGRSHGVIVSIDGAGVATLHYPADPDAPTALAGTTMSALDHAYELDDAPGFERFFFVTGEENDDVDARAVMDAARKLARTPAARRGRLELPRAWSQVEFLLVKDADQ